MKHWNEALANTLALVVIAGAILLMIAEVARISSDSFLYLLGDNFFAFGAVLSVILALMLARQSDPPLPSVQLPRLIALAALIVPLLTLIYYRQIFTLQMLTSLLIGIAIVVVARGLTLESPSDPADRRTPTRSLYGLYLLLALVMAAGIGLRLIAPGSTVLTWGIAPLVVLLVPGLSLAQVLLPDRVLIEQVGYAFPLSISTQLIVILWLDLLHIPISLPLLFISAGAITLIGFLGAIFRQRG